MSGGGNINRPFVLCPGGNIACGDFIFGWNQKAVLMPVQRQKRFSGISTPPIAQKRAHAPKNARKIDLRHHATPTPTPPQSIPPRADIPPPPRQSPPPLPSPSIPSIKRGLTGRKWGAKPYKTPQNRWIRKLSKTIQNSPKPPKIASSPVFI